METSQNEEDRKNYCEVKRDIKKKYIWLWIRKLGKQWSRLIRVVIIMSCLELPNKELGEKCWG